MIAKDERCLRIGILGCGPIAQFAHLDACRKARNAELYAICDLADDLRERMEAIHQPKVAYADYDAMLADPRVEAVDHRDRRPVSRAGRPQGDRGRQARAGRETAGDGGRAVPRAARSGGGRQAGRSGRQQPPVRPGHRLCTHFIVGEMGQRIALKSWYYDSVYRYTMTDNLQPIPITSDQARRPEGDPKADRRRYYLLTHGSHLVDTARFLGGPIVGLRARLLERFGAYCWFIAVDFADGSLGHLDLQIPVRGDFQEGFQVQGEHGSVTGRVHLPWFHKSSDVECFSARDRQFHRILGEDAFTYKLQIEGFAATILEGLPQTARASTTAWRPCRRWWRSRGRSRRKNMSGSTM